MDLPVGEKRHRDAQAVSTPATVSTASSASSAPYSASKRVRGTDNTFSVSWKADVDGGEAAMEWTDSLPSSPKQASPLDNAAVARQVRFTEQPECVVLPIDQAENAGKPGDVGGKPGEGSGQPDEGGGVVITAEAMSDIVEGGFTLLDYLSGCPFSGLHEVDPAYDGLCKPAESIRRTEQVAKEQIRSGLATIQAAWPDVDALIQRSSLFHLIPSRLQLHEGRVGAMLRAVGGHRSTATEAAAALCAQLPANTPPITGLADKLAGTMTAVANCACLAYGRRVRIAMRARRALPPTLASPTDAAAAAAKAVVGDGETDGPSLGGRLEAERAAIVEHSAEPIASRTQARASLQVLGAGISEIYRTHCEKLSLQARLERLYGVGDAAAAEALAALLLGIADLARAFAFSASVHAKLTTLANRLAPGDPTPPRSMEDDGDDEVAGEEAEEAADGHAAEDHDEPTEPYGASLDMDESGDGL